MDRRVKARRDESDRRDTETKVELERRHVPRRAKVARRRQIDPTTCERDYNQDEIEFMHALDAYKRTAGRMFPTCSEVLEVLRDLGYQRRAPEERAKLQPAAGVTSTAETTVDESIPMEETLDHLEL